MHKIEASAPTLTANMWLALALVMLAERKGFAYTEQELVDAVATTMDVYGCIEKACTAIRAQLTTLPN